MSALLQVNGVTKKFGGLTAVREVSLSLLRGEIGCLLGPSGCGKTTLLRVIAGLEEQNSGSVWIAGRDVSREPVANRKLGIVFQSYALFPNINILGNVQYGINRRQFSKSEREQRAMEMLELVGIEEQSYKYPAQLSGGQQQRVALARALAPSPTILLLDEPAAGLNIYETAEVGRLISKIRDLGVTVLLVEHDMSLVMDISDEIVVLSFGEKIAEDVPEAIQQNTEVIKVYLGE